MANEQFKSILQLEKMSFEEISYSRKTDIPISNIEYEMNFNRQIQNGEDDRHFKVSLTANIWSKTDDIIKLKVTLVGYFMCECDDTVLKNQLIRFNTISILFPYIRSQISLITTQPDCVPIILPPMNIVSLFQDADQQIHE